MLPREKATLGSVHRRIDATVKLFRIVSSATVPIPLERIAMRGNRLIVQGLTEDQIRAMPTFERNDRRYRDLDGNQQVQISTTR